MQAAEEQARAPEKKPDPGFLSPGRAFALLVGVIVLLGLVIFLLRPDPPRGRVTYPGNAEPPTFELTDAEALARLASLNSLRERAYAEVDPSLLSMIYTSDSRVRGIVTQELRRLRRESVVDLSRFETQSARVIENSSREIRIREVVVVHPRFETENGKNVTSQPEPVRQTQIWTLRLENGSWLVYDALITRSAIVSE